MYPEIHFGFIKLPLYSLLFIIAYFFMILFARKIAKRYYYPEMDILFVSIYAFIGIMVGAKAVYFISKLPTIISEFDIFMNYIKTDFLGALNYMFGGLVFYGGLIGAVLGAFIYCKQYKMPFIPLMDIFAPLIPFVHGVGRIGCFFAGCCYGKEYHGFGSIQFPPNEQIPVLDDVPRFPVQLMEAGLNFLISIILLLLMYRGKMKAGQLLGIYLIYYTVIRFLTEMFRGDETRGNIGGISTSQIISILLIPIAIILIHGGFIKKKFPKSSEELSC